jgi:hypothetical protein
MYASYSYWIGKEIELAHEYSKPIVGLRPWGLSAALLLFECGG